jgi:hypothetical protein
MATMPTEAKRQNDFKAGRTVVPPIAKATTSVMEVMVMATPEWERVLPKRSVRLSVWKFQNRK